MLNRILRRYCLPLSALILLACGGGHSSDQTASRRAPAKVVGVATQLPSAPRNATIQASAGLPVIRFSTSSGGQARLAVEVDSNDPERSRGLMGVTSLPADQGQFFVFQDIAPNQDVQIGFWMKDTLVPLSIAFLGADGTVEEIQDMQPQSLDVHQPQRPYRYAVEANQGWYARHGVAAGSRVDLSAALGH